MQASLADYLDLDTLDMLKEVMEDDFLVLIETFFNDSRVRINEIEQAIEQQDQEQLRRAAHCFKGSAANLGAHVLSEHCRILEQAAVEGNLSNIKTMQQEIIDHFALVEKLVKEQVIP